MYKRQTTSWLKHWDFVLIDIVCGQIAFLISYFIRHGLKNPYDSRLYFNSALIMILLAIAVSVFLESFRDILKRGYYIEFRESLKHVAMITVLQIVYLFLIQEGDAYSRITLIVSGVVYFVLTYVARIIWKNVLKHRLANKGKRRLIIVTKLENSCELIKSLREHNVYGFKLTGIVLTDVDVTESVIDGVPVVARVDELVKYTCNNWVDEIFISLPPEEFLDPETMEALKLSGTVIHINVANESIGEGQKQFVERIGNNVVLTISMNYATTGQLFAKRLMDIVCGIIGCIITGILFIFLAPAIKIASPGPVFFAQERVGKNGKRFKMYKFRSMYMDAEERKAELMNKNKISSDFMFKMDEDPRIIGSKILPDGTYKKGIGNFIRDWSLDEYPQFWNVLKGDCSVVGTRPPLPKEVSGYAVHHYSRLAIKPGITGMWQVSGRSKITEFEDVVKLDAEYINNWNIGLDIKILLKTIKVVMRKDGAV